METCLIFLIPYQQALNVGGRSIKEYIYIKNIYKKQYIKINYTYNLYIK